MAKRVQLRRGTTVQTNAFTGALGEVTVDTDKDVVVVHDGATAGGFATAARANADGSVTVVNKTGVVLATIPAVGLLNNTLTSTATDQAATAAQVKVLQDGKLGISANAVSATKLATTRAITLTGDVTGTVNFDGTAAVSITTTVVDDSHSHIIANVDGLQTTLDSISKTVTATLPATAGWYRIATSAVDIGRNSGRFELDWTLSGNHGQVIFNAAIMYSTGVALNQNLFSTYAASGLTKARIVYHTTNTANYAYLEVYNSTAAAIAVTATGLGLMGWTLLTPSTVGSIPTGYTSRELTFVDGQSTEGQYVSTVATGTAPLSVSSTTVVTNLNADLLDGYNTAVTATASSIPVRDAGGVLAGNILGSATSLATARTFTWTGDATGSVSFNGAANVSNALTLAASGVTAGTYEQVTVDAKGRVTSAANVITGLVTSTTSGGTTNLATTNTNTFLNVVETVGGSAISTGTSQQVTGAGTVTVASDTAGKLTITGAQAITGNAGTATKLATARTINGIAFDGTANITVPLGTINNTLTSTSTTEGLSANMGRALNAAKLDLTGGTLTGGLTAPSFTSTGTITADDGFVGNATSATKLSTASGSAPSYSVRAWANFNGVGSISIRGQGNVASITDNATGDYTINFATAMPDANYAVALTHASGAGAAGTFMIRAEIGEGAATLKTASALRVIYKGVGNGSLYDIADANVVIFR